MVKLITADVAREMAAYRIDRLTRRFNDAITNRINLDDGPGFGVTFQEPEEDIKILHKYAVDSGFAVLDMYRLHPDGFMNYWVLKISWE